MRVFATFVVLAFVGCDGSGSSNGSDGGSTSQCSETATQICNKAASCSTGHDGGVTVFIVAAVDGGLNSHGITVNGDESHCLNFLNLMCVSQHAATFTAACSPEVSGLQCGTDSMFGNGVVLPPPCGQSF